MRKSSYAYTKQGEARQIKAPKLGAQNVAMTYAGPPNQAEIHRNKGRNDQNKSSIVL